MYRIQKSTYIVLQQTRVYTRLTMTLPPVSACFYSHSEPPQDKLILFPRLAICRGTMGLWYLTIRSKLSLRSYQNWLTLHSGGFGLFTKHRYWPYSIRHTEGLFFCLARKQFRVVGNRQTMQPNWTSKKKTFYQSVAPSGHLSLLD